MLTQKMIAELFDVGVNTINYHLKEIFESGELIEDSVIRKYRTTATDGKNYQVMYYNLDAIISVGYRVNSLRATQFRQWATNILGDFAIRGSTAAEVIYKRADRFVSMYLDYAESQAERNIPMTMEDWAKKLNAFLQFNEREGFENSRKVTAIIAKEFAESEFEKYRTIQDKLFKSNFDRLTEILE